MSNHRPAVRALAVAALAGAYLTLLGLEPPIHKDSSRDMLLARDGLEFGIFDGCSAAFGDFRQGVLWIRFLALTFAAGLGPVGQHAILAVLLVSSVCLLDRTAIDHFGEDLGWAPAAVFLALLLVATGYPNLWNPIFAPLGIACLTLALLQVVTRGSSVAACASGASLALAAEGHPAALLTAPVVVAAVCLSCRRPVRVLFASILAGALPSFAASSSSWLHNGRAMLLTPWYVPLIAVGLAGAVGAGVTLRGGWLALALERRRRWLLAMIVASVVVQAAAASALSHTVLFSPQYYLSTLPALAILIGLGLRRIRVRFGLWGRALAAAIVACLLLVPVSAAMAWRFGISAGFASVPNYSMREARILASWFWTAGYTFPDLQRHLRGPDGFVLIASMAPFATEPNGSVERPMEDLRVLAFAGPNEPPGGLPAGGRDVDLGYGRRAWILPIDGWVRLAPARVCFTAQTGGHASFCADVASSSIPYPGRYRDLAFPALGGVHDASDRLRAALGEHSMKTTWELPVVIDGEDTEREFDLVGVIGAPWVIERVEGVRHRGATPSRHVVLERGGGTSGRIVLSSTVNPWQDYPPDFLETRPGEAALRHSLRQLPPFGDSVCRRLGTCP